MRFIPNSKTILKIELVVPNDLSEIAIKAIVSGARTGKIGDGKIFISDVGQVVRIRNDERGESEAWLSLRPLP